MAIASLCSSAVGVGSPTTLASCSRLSFVDVSAATGHAPRAHGPASHAFAHPHMGTWVAACAHACMSHAQVTSTRAGGDAFWCAPILAWPCRARTGIAGGEADQMRQDGAAGVERRVKEPRVGVTDHEGRGQLDIVLEDSQLPGLKACRDLRSVALPAAERRRHVRRALRLRLVRGAAAVPASIDVALGV